MISEPALDRLSAMFQGPDVSGTRYELISVLGRGGMGVVYLARDAVLDREVALKIVERLSEDANEARILARLEHPGIVPVHDFGELPDGRLFYAMKRVRGDRLDRWMAAGRGLAEKLGVFLRVCEAVAFAHAHEVLHRDLKHENVMVGPFGEALVMDWGLARRLGSTEARGAAVTGPGGTLAGAIVGTPAYMAPEQARGAEVTSRSDVYGLGAILSSLLAGSPPGPTPSPLEQTSPPAVISICLKAMAAAPTDRYPSALELGDDVGRFLEQDPVRAHPETLLERLRRFASRNSVVLSLLGVYLLVRLVLLLLPR